MAPILRFIISSGSKKKKLRFACLSEAKVSHSHKKWTEFSSSVPHFLQVGLLHNPITYGCLLRLLFPVRSVMTLDCVLLMDSNQGSVAGLVPEINSWDWNSYVLSGIMCRSLISKFTNIGLHTWKVQMEISLCPWVKYGFHSVSFHKTLSQWIDFIRLY